MTDRLYDVDFDGRRVASGVGVGWSDDGQRSLPLASGVTGSFGHIAIETAEVTTNRHVHDAPTEEVDVFVHTDHTQSNPLYSHEQVSIESRTLLDGTGAHSAGPWLVYPAAVE